MGDTVGRMKVRECGRSLEPEVPEFEFVATGLRNENCAERDAPGIWAASKMR